MNSDSSAPMTAAASLVYVLSLNHLATTCRDSFSDGRRYGLTQGWRGLTAYMRYTKSASWRRFWTM